MTKIMFVLFLFSSLSQAAVLNFPQKTQLKSSLVKNSFSPIPTLNAFFVKENVPNGSIEFTVIRTDPSTVANKISIEKMWKADRSLASTDKMTKDFGCKKVSSHQFQCERAIAKKDYYQFQRLIWHKKKDLVVIQANSKKDSALAMQYAQSFTLVDVK